MDRGSGARGPLLGTIALVACCALLPVLIGLGATGLLAVIGGAAARYWPLTVLGLSALLWAGLRIRRVIRNRGQAKDEAHVREG